MKKIRRRNGEDAMVDDDYILANGETMSIPFSMMDSASRMITDSRGGPAGCRPGFLYSDANVADAVLETVHRQYRDDISERWKSDRWSGPPARTAQPVRSQTSPQTTVDAAYEEYRTGIENRWRR